MARASARLEGVLEEIMLLSHYGGFMIREESNLTNSSLQKMFGSMSVSLQL